MGGARNKQLGRGRSKRSMQQTSKQKQKQKHKEKEKEKDKDKEIPNVDKNDGEKCPQPQSLPSTNRFTLLAPSSNSSSSWTSDSPATRHEESSFAEDEASDSSGGALESSLEWTVVDDQGHLLKDIIKGPACMVFNDDSCTDFDATLHQISDFKTTSAICNTTRVPSTTFFVESPSAEVATAMLAFVQDVPRPLSAIDEANEEEEDGQLSRIVSHGSANSEVRVVLPPPLGMSGPPLGNSVSQPQQPPVILNASAAPCNARASVAEVKRPLVTRKRRDEIKLDINEERPVDHTRSNRAHYWTDTAVDSNPSSLTESTLYRESWFQESSKLGSGSPYGNYASPNANVLDDLATSAAANAQSASSSNYIDLIPLQDTSSVYQHLRDFVQTKYEEIHFQEDFTAAYQIPPDLETIEISPTASSGGLSIGTVEDFNPDTLRMSHEKESIYSSLREKKSQPMDQSAGQYCRELYQSPNALTVETSRSSEKDTICSVAPLRPHTTDTTPLDSPKKGPPVYYRVPSAEVRTLLKIDAPKSVSTPPLLDLFELCSENFRPLTAASVHSSMENFAPLQNAEEAATPLSTTTTSSSSASRGASNVSAARWKTRKLDNAVTGLDRSPPLVHLDCLTSSSNLTKKSETESSLLELLTDRSSQKPIPFVSNGTPLITMLTDPKNPSSEAIAGQENRTPPTNFTSSSTNTAPVDDFNFGDWKNRLDSKLGLDDDFHIELKSPAAILRPISANTSRSRTAYTAGSRLISAGATMKDEQPVMFQSEYKASRVMTSIRQQQSLHAAAPRRTDTVKSTALNLENYQQLSATAPPPNGKRRAESYLEQDGAWDGSTGSEKEEDGLASVAGSMRKMTLTDRFRTTFRKRQIIDRDGYVERNDLNTGYFDFSTTAAVTGAAGNPPQISRREKELSKKKRGILARLRIRRNEGMQPPTVRVE